MAEKESNDRPSLELPSLGFGRKRKRPATEDAAPPPEPSADTAPEPTSEPVALEPDPTHRPEPDTEPDPEPVTDAAPTQRLDPVPAAPAAPPLFVDEAPAARPAETTVATAYVEAEDEDEDEDEPAPGVRKQRRDVALPAIGGMAAAVVTGLLVGLLTVALTWGSLRLCEVVQGTPSCGNPGFFLLLAIMVTMVLVGQALLRAFGVPDPGSTSFLGMGVVAVVALLFLVDLLFLWWMVLVIPAVAMAAYALSHWVTTAFVEPAETNLHR